MCVIQVQGKRESGFTLLEAMATAGILAVMTMIAIPAFMSWMPGMRLNGATRQVMGDLMAARMQAVKQNNEFKVFFNSPGTNQYQILDDNDNDGIADTGEAITTKNIQDNYHDVTFSATSDPIFFPRGTAYGTIVTVTNSKGAQKKVKVHLTGRIMIEDV
jgi:type IV fimbrial biogenesis protein FimT